MEKTFDYKKLEASWNTTDQDGYHIDWGEPSEELCVYANELAESIYGMNPFGFSYESFGEIFWHDKLWDITDNEELVTRIVEVFYDLAEDQFSKKDLRLVKVFLNGIEFESAPK